MYGAYLYTKLVSSFVIKTKAKNTKIWYSTAAVVIAVIVIASLFFFYHPAEVRNNQLRGSIVNVSTKPYTCPILNVSLGNPSALSDPYNVTITLDLSNGTSVAMHYSGSGGVWESGEYSAIVNIQHNKALYDNVIQSGTLIVIGVNSTNPYNFQGTNFILTYSGYSGAITYSIQ